MSVRKMKQQVMKGENAQLLLQKFGLCRTNSFEVFYGGGEEHLFYLCLEVCLEVGHIYPWWTSLTEALAQVREDFAFAVYV